jgi:hypothetical protein
MRLALPSDFFLPASPPGPRRGDLPVSPKNLRKNIVNVVLHFHIPPRSLADLNPHPHGGSGYPPATRSKLPTP